MARIFTDGAEMRDTLFFDYADCSVDNVTPDPQFSAYYYDLGNAYKIVSALSECYLRERIYLASSAFGDAWALNIPAFRNGTTQLAILQCDNMRHPQIVIAGGATTVSAYTVNANQWYLWEMYYKIDGVNGRFVLIQDGVTIIDYTGDTLYSAYSTFDNIYWSSHGQVCVDDLALNDTTGGSDDSYCGDGVIIKVTPDGDGAHNNWHGSDLDDLSNYLLVDDYPKDDDTTYVYHDGSASGTQDQYALSDYDGTDKTITRIYPEARVRKTAAAAYTVKLGILASGGVDDMSAAQNLSTTYARFVGDEYTVNPVDSNPWEEADIDALQFVIEVG